MKEATRFLVQRAKGKGSDTVGTYPGVTAVTAGGLPVAVCRHDTTHVYADRSVR